MKKRGQKNLSASVLVNGRQFKLSSNPNTWDGPDQVFRSRKCRSLHRHLRLNGKKGFESFFPLNSQP